MSRTGKSLHGLQVGRLYSHTSNNFCGITVLYVTEDKLVALTVLPEDQKPLEVYNPCERNNCYFMCAIRTDGKVQLSMWYGF